MGRKYKAKCQNCGYIFEVREGGGFNFYLLHCHECGAEKTVTMQEIQTAKSSFVDYKDKTNKDIAELLAGSCSDGGLYRVSSKAKCPKCFSKCYSIYTVQGIAEVSYYD